MSGTCSASDTRAIGVSIYQDSRIRTRGSKRSHRGPCAPELGPARYKCHAFIAYSMRGLGVQQSLVSYEESEPFVRLRRLNSVSDQPNFPLGLASDHQPT